MRRCFLLVHNPYAGSKASTLTARTSAALEARGAAITRAGLGELAAEAGSGRYDAVIAAGGDGTFRAAAAVLSGLDIPIGIVPAGTGNVLAAEIGLSRNPGAIAEVLLSGPVVTTRAGLANSTPFHLMVGAGFDGEVIRRLDSALKQRIGKLAYSAPITAALFTRFPPLAVTADGQRHEADWVVVAKGRSYAGAFVIAPRAVITSDTVEVVLCRGRGAAIRAAQLLAVAAGQVLHAPGVKILTARRVVIEAERPLPVEADGDAFGTTRLDITAEGPTIPLIVPEAFARSRT